MPIFGTQHLSSCSVTSPLALVGCQELTGSALAKSASAKSAAAARAEAGEEEEKMEENTAAEGAEEEAEEEQEKTTAIERVDKRVRRGYLHFTVCPQRDFSRKIH